MLQIRSFKADVYNEQQIRLAQSSRGIFLAPLELNTLKTTGRLYFKAACELLPQLPAGLRYTARIRNTGDFCFNPLNAALGMPLFKIVNSQEIIYQPVVTSQLNPVFLPFELICLNANHRHLAADIAFYVSDLKPRSTNIIACNPIVEVY
jgi:hypothetical protein